MGTPDVDVVSTVCVDHLHADRDLEPEEKRHTEL
jgi:hypothetical protein